jgi:hypothetical protein
MRLPHDNLPLFKKATVPVGAQIAMLGLPPGVEPLQEDHQRNFIDQSARVFIATNRCGRISGFVRLVRRHDRKKVNEIAAPTRFARRVLRLVGAVVK